MNAVKNSTTPLEAILGTFYDEKTTNIVDATNRHLGGSHVCSTKDLKSNSFCFSSRHDSRTKKRWREDGLGGCSFRSDCSNCFLA